MSGLRIEVLLKSPAPAVKSFTCNPVEAGLTYAEIVQLMGVRELSGSTPCHGYFRHNAVCLETSMASLHTRSRLARYYGHYPLNCLGRDRSIRLLVSESGVQLRKKLMALTYMIAVDMGTREPR